MHLTTLEAAKVLGVTDGSVREKCHCGTLKCEKVPNKYHLGGSWLVDPASLAEYLAKRDEPKCKHLAPVDAAWLAGFLDGEGCLTAFTTRVKSNVSDRKCSTTRYFIQVLVVEQEPIEWIKRVTGVGYVFQRKRKEQNYQDLWGWRADNHTGCAVIRQIMPYLKIKRRHAGIFLELEKRIVMSKNWRQGKDTYAPMPKEEWIERQKLIDEIHRLNKPTGKVLRKEYSLAETT